MKSELSYLAKLITMIGEEGNETQIKKLWSLVGLLAKKEIGNLQEKESMDLLSEMHELTMEQYIRVQAIHFYDGFAYPEIKHQLIEDFVEMEHCKRRDDFEGFALCTFQQLENITNHIFNETDIWEKAKLNVNIQMYSYYDKDSQTFKRFGGTLGESIPYIPPNEDKSVVVQSFFNKHKEKVEFFPRYKLVLYYAYFNEVVKSYDEWNRISFSGYDLYLCRNENHRGSIYKENQQKRRTDLLDNRYKYYLVFQGLLAEFTSKLKRLILVKDVKRKKVEGKKNSQT